MAKNLVEDFQDAIVMDFSLKQPIHIGWSVPFLGTFKAYIDSTTSTAGDKISGVGVVIQDEEGRVVVDLIKLLPSHYLAD